MTYCVGLLVDTGWVLLSDSRTNAGVDQVNTFRKMATFVLPGERALGRSLNRSVQRVARS